MADLDAEFAKFQAELFETEMAALAEQQPAEVRSTLLVGASGLPCNLLVTAAD
jgi:hypothetical protein